MTKKAANITREEIQKAMTAFTAKGGKIDVLPSSVVYTRAYVNGSAAHDVYEDIETFSDLEVIHLVDQKSASL